MLGIDPKPARYAWSALAAPAAACLLYLMRRTVFVFVVAVMLAYLLHPLVDAVDRRMSRKRRAWAIALPFVLILGLAGVFGTFLAGQVHIEAEQLLARGNSQEFVSRVKAWSPLGLPVGEQIAENSKDLLVMLPQLRIGQRLLTASRGLIDILIVPILSFLILKDGRRIRESLLAILGDRRAIAETMLRDAHKLMLNYMRSLLLLCLTTLVSFSVGLSLLGVRYAFLLASVAFLLEFVPMAGPLAAGILIVSVVHFGGYPHPLWWVVCFLAIYRLFLDYVVAPQVMQKGVELHPLVVLFGVFAGAEIGGIAGIFLSVPVLALLRLLYFESRMRRAFAEDLHLQKVHCAGELEVFSEEALV